MKCPVDGETLVIADRNGVEIDYCPSCRGVWLDRGELDKIIERASAYAAPPAPPPSENVPPCLLSTSPRPRDGLPSRIPSSSLHKKKLTIIPIT